MSVWFAIPSIRPAEEANSRFEVWRRMGYRIALLRQGELLPDIDLQLPTERYQGWARSTNILAREIMQRDPEAQWIVGGGDDYLPVQTHQAAEIARQCCDHFLETARTVRNGSTPTGAATFGVMQPTGDRWGEGLWPTDPHSAVIDRIAGSPWLGREWCRRAYGGRGPLWEAYWHNWADQELQEVAQRLGVFWQRRDLCQYHAHWARPRGSAADRPKWAEFINGPEYHLSKPLFDHRQATGFPGSDPVRA